MILKNILKDLFLRKNYIFNKKKTLDAPLVIL